MSALYQDAIDILTSQGKFYINLGLERVQKILELLGNPHKKMKYIHVAGTNGKGSTSAILSSILSETTSTLHPTSGEGERSFDEEMHKSQQKEQIPTLLSFAGEGGWKPDEGSKKIFQQRAKYLRNESTTPEQILWYYLRDRRFCNLKFRRQFVIEKYIADFICLEKRLIIELDGSQHLQNKNIEYDKKRDAFLREQDFEILRFFNNDIFNNIESILEEIYQKTCATPHPLPLSRKGRGEDLINPSTQAEEDSWEPNEGANLKVGLFTSPHIFEYTERIKINNVEIEKEVFAKKLIEIVELAEKNGIHLTEFEILTTLAFDYFAQNNVDVVVLETGLGGRLDATNVIKENLCSIITKIDLDHTERLGNSIEEIAGEKGGIIKENCPVITTKNNLGLNIFKKIAQEKNSHLFIAKEVSLADVEHLSLLGIWQKENLGLALEAVEILNAKGYQITQEAIYKGLKSVKHPCRFEYLEEHNILIDGAHNPNGTKVLRESLDYYFPDKKIKFIFGCLNNKQYPEMMENLFHEGDDIYFYQFDNPNSCTYKELDSACEFTSQDFKDYKNGEANTLTVICGSFYMIKELLTKMGIK